MGSGTCRGSLLLTDEEASRLADALKNFNMPRSFIILEAIQAGLQNPNPAEIPGRRSVRLCFRLPVELRDKARESAAERHISQQSLIRHFLFTYLSQLRGKSSPPTRPSGPTLAEEIAVDT